MNCESCMTLTAEIHYTMLKHKYKQRTPLLLRLCIKCYSAVKNSEVTDYHVYELSRDEYSLEMLRRSL